MMRRREEKKKAQYGATLVFAQSERKRLTSFLSNERTWTLIPKPSRCVCVFVTQYHSRKRPAPSERLLLTARENGQTKGVKGEGHSGRAQAHSCGSVLQFLITVFSD